MKKIRVVTMGLNQRFQAGHRTRVHSMWRKAPLLLRPSVQRQTDHLAQNVPSGKKSLCWVHIKLLPAALDRERESHPPPF